MAKRKRIGEVRSGCGFTVQEAAEHVGISAEELVMHESNPGAMPFGIALNLLKLYNTPFSSVEFD